MAQSSSTLWQRSAALSRLAHSESPSKSGLILNYPSLALCAAIRQTGHCCMYHQAAGTGPVRKVRHTTLSARQPKWGPTYEAAYRTARRRGCLIYVHGLNLSIRRALKGGKSEGMRSVYLPVAPN
ncbi:unnamed protein product [Protopolystoma xenopodis]|uniref:Uncharacterized protein n=1 Tax=Protopolystoma xenopodis TaxID=117903 RepID=A0A3S5FGY0_9PLAT|nr:unnamed protein product [Protopolystoma xenopodis]